MFVWRRLKLPVLFERSWNKYKCMAVGISYDKSKEPKRGPPPCVGGPKIAGGVRPPPPVPRGEIAGRALPLNGGNSWRGGGGWTPPAISPL